MPGDVFGVTPVAAEVLLASGALPNSSNAQHKPAVKSLLGQNINSAEVGRRFSPGQVDPLAPSSSSGGLKQFPPPKFQVACGFDIVLVQSRIDKFIPREG